MTGVHGQAGNVESVRLFYTSVNLTVPAKAFFAQAYEVAEQVPQRIATDGHTSYPRAIAEELGGCIPVLQVSN